MTSYSARPDEVTVSLEVDRVVRLAGDVGDVLTAAAAVLRPRGLIPAVPAAFLRDVVDLNEALAHGAGAYDTLTSGWRSKRFIACSSPAGGPQNLLHQPIPSIRPQAKGVPLSPR